MFVIDVQTSNFYLEAGMILMIKKIARQFIQFGALSALALTTQVQANEAADSEQSNFAVLADIGVGHQKLDVSGGYHTESGNAFSAALGLEYKINSEFSAIVQYADYGEADLFGAEIPVAGQEVGVDFSAKTKGLSLVGQYMTARAVDNWSFGAKLGMISWDTDMYIKASGNDSSAKVTFGSDDGTSIVGGLLASYAFNQQMDVYFNADWFVSDVDGQIIEGETNEILRARYTVGLKYHF